MTSLFKCSLLTIGKLPNAYFALFRNSAGVAALLLRQFYIPIALILKSLYKECKGSAEVSGTQDKDLDELDRRWAESRKEKVDFMICVVSS